jgi:hypothetical protein
MIQWKNRTLQAFDHYNMHGVVLAAEKEEELIQNSHCDTYQPKDRHYTEVTIMNCVSKHETY